ncbi:hypothetical protein BH09BAC4_BH09BAC4_01000 [soil metagenome]
MFKYRGTATNGAVPLYLNKIDTSRFFLNS